MNTTRSTKIKEDEKCDNTDLDNGIKTNCIYAATIDAGQIYMNQTGRFPVVSSKGKKLHHGIISVWW
jgi:hypothetical protein